MNISEKVDFIKTVFMGGVKRQLKEEWVWGTAAGIGLYQGLKYSGSIKKGIAGGVATLMVIAGANGLYNVAAEWDKITKHMKEE